MPSNYRPISLLAVGYKIFASLLLHRLKEAGAEQRIINSQYGFKSNAGTRDAIFIVRRLIEKCITEKNQHIIFLALDWAKAFDSIAPASLARALYRFGIPQSIITIIMNIYSDRHFFVQDHFGKSQLHRQHFGISQGCPLSPFLFIILMSVLMNDAQQILASKSDIHAHDTAD